MTYINLVKFMRKRLRDIFKVGCRLNTTWEKRLCANDCICIVALLR